MMKKSRIYDNLNTEKRKTLSPTNFGYATDQIHIQQSNSSDLMDTALIGYTANQLSSSGPIPGTQEIVQVTKTSDVGFFDIFKPDPGTVYKFVGGDLLASGGTATINFSLTDGSSYAYVGNTSVSGQEPLTFDNLYKLPDLYVTNEVWFGGDFSTIATSARVSMCFIRVR